MGIKGNIHIVSVKSTQKSVKVSAFARVYNQRQ